MRVNLKIYFRLLKANIKTMMGFRADFFLLLISGSLTQILGIIFVFTLFSNIPSIKGWTMYEIILIFSIVFIVEGLVSLFFDGIWNLTSMVNSGDFDRILLRPVHPIIQIITSSLGSQGIGNLLIGTILLIYSIHYLNIFSIYNISMAILFIIFGVIVRSSINICVGAMAFWTKSGNPLMIANQSLSEFSKYPLSIYNTGVKILVIIIPYTFIGFVPTLFLLNKESKGIFFVSYILVIFYCIFSARYVLKKGIENYDSTGN